MEKSKPIVIGVGGGSGSGKTTIINSIIDELGDYDIVTLQHDSYYKDNRHLPFYEREKVNYDHPDALETNLFVQHLKELIAGREVETPIYDFTTHTRKKHGERKKPAQIIIVEGILIFVEKELRELMDVKIFVSTNSDIRFIRRLKRDMAERNRSMDSVINQYLKTVRPMHLAYVEPSRRHADIIIPEGHNPVSSHMIVAMIKQHSKKRENLVKESKR